MPAAARATALDDERDEGSKGGGGVADAALDASHAMPAADAPSLPATGRGLGAADWDDMLAALAGGGDDLPPLEILALRPAGAGTAVDNGNADGGDDGDGDDSHETGDERLLRAVRSGRLAAAQTLLDNGLANVNARTPAVDTVPGGRTPLILACLSGDGRGDESMLWLLLRGAADVNAVDDSGRTALMYASEVGNNGYARILAENGASARIAASDGTTALHLACERGDARLAKFLLQRCGADANACTADGVAPLTLAAAQGAAELVTLLLDSGAAVDGPPETSTDFADGPTPLMAACEAGDVRLVRWLLDRGANVRRRCGLLGGIGCVFKAAEAGNVGLVTVLLERGAPVNLHDARGRTVLSHVCEMGLFPLVTPTAAVAIAEALLAHGADPLDVDDHGRTPLAYACEHPEPALLALLAKHTRPARRR